MFIHKSADLLYIELQKQRSQGNKIGFVPTMGALHTGHRSLLERARAENDTVVCSIFVNPTQFDDKADLDNYPSTIDSDMEMLRSVNVDYLYYPEVEYVYPNGEASDDVDLAGLDVIHEGALRPGHFQGVAQVVKRFFEIVQPTSAYFGQKDFQQTAVIGQLIKVCDFDTKMVVCPIVREPHGLAMSSRNERLSPVERDKASFIYKSLLKLKERCFFKPLSEALITTIKYLKSIEDASLEYLICVDGDSLQEVNELSDSDYVVALTVVKYGGVRLLDNIILKKPKV